MGLAIAPLCGADQDGLSCTPAVGAGSGCTPVCGTSQASLRWQSRACAPPSMPSVARPAPQPSMRGGWSNTPSWRGGTPFQVLWGLEPPAGWPRSPEWYRPHKTPCSSSPCKLARVSDGAVLPFWQLMPSGVLLRLLPSGCAMGEGWENTN